jgi:hypothetical protein
MQELKQNKCARSRKRIPFVHLAGSLLPPRCVDALPNEEPPAPQDSPPHVPLTLDVKKLLESWRQQSPHNLKTLDDVAPVALPKCRHGIRLTADEFRFEAQYKNKFHKRMDGKSYFIPKSFECVDCHPVCIHGKELNAAERDSRKRFSFDCPACNSEVKDPEKIEEFLKKQNLGIHYGMALTEGEVVTSYGLRISKAGKNFAQGGNLKEMEEQDIELQDTTERLENTEEATSGNEHTN